MNSLHVATAHDTGKSPYRMDSLLALRGLAAFSVVCHHLGVGPALAAAAGVAALGAFSISGSYAVSIFFCLSGYLMAKILDRNYRSTARFYWNRLARVLPTYYLAMAVTIVVLGHQVSAADWPTFLLLNNYFSTSFPNAPLWSLATECQFYLFAPGIAWLSARWRPAPLALFVVGVAVRLFYWFGFDLLPAQDIAYMSLEANLIYFMAGWIAYTYRDVLPVISARRGLLLVIVIIAAIWLFHLNFIPNTPIGLYSSAAWMLTFPLIMCGLAVAVLPGLDDGTRQKATTPATIVLCFLGVTSYSAYVLHVPLIQTTVVPMSINLLLIYAAAGLVFIGFERPLFRLRTS